MLLQQTILLFIISYCSLAFPRPNERIIGGTVANPGQFPFVVSLNADFIPGHYCGASIISRNWIVTAAHCVLYPEQYYSVQSDTILLSSGGTNYTIESIYIHPDFTHSNSTNDLALVKIQGVFTLSHTAQIIEIDDVKPNEKCTVLGWGQTETEESSEVLQFVELSALSAPDCDKLAQGGDHIFPRNEGQVCALADNGKSPCYGDSGGPLICHGKLVGVVSYAIKPCAKGYPDVYTKLSYYQNWIENVIKN